MLPNDYTRCPGYAMEQCQWCQRLERNPAPFQQMMMPPEPMPFDRECPQLIPWRVTVTRSSG